MKLEMRRELARQSLEQKIRKVGELIQLGAMGGDIALSHHHARNRPEHGRS